MSIPASDLPPASTPQISVIVRSMARPSLSLALDSIALQETPALEVLVVNARGPDHGPVPAAAGVHPVRRVDLGRALPRAVAANAGLDAATGSRVIFLDDDDVFLPGHLERLAAALQAHPDAVAAYADVAYGHRDASGWVTKHVFAAEFDPLRLRFENFLPLHAVLVDRSSADLRACRFDESLALFEDWDWWLQLARLGRFVRVPGISAHYVATDGGGSGVFSGDARSCRSREQLLQKWLALDSPQDRMALLLALQRQYRAAQTGAEQAAARLRERMESEQQIDSLRVLIAAREHEISKSSEYLAGLTATLNHERSDRQAELQALRALVQARERELDDTRLRAENLDRIVAARDNEIAALKAQLDLVLSEGPLEAFTRALRNRNHERS